MSDYTTLSILCLIAIMTTLSYNYLSKPSFYNHDLLYNYCIDRENLNTKKPILWLFVPTHINSRNWSNFYSRNSTQINQPYLYITLKSIIDYCSESFNILIINEESFSSLLPYWNINFNHLTSPIKDHFIHIGIHKLLYDYGGMTIPCSFLCKRNLIDLYNVGLKKQHVFVVENINSTVTASDSPYIPDQSIMGCKKGNPLMMELIQFESTLYNTDLTSESDFTGEVQLWLTNKHINHQITVIDSCYVGVKTWDNQMILVDDLLSTKSSLNVIPTCYGILLPQKQLLTQLKYQWFVRMNTSQLLESDLTIIKYI